MQYVSSSRQKHVWIQMHHRDECVAVKKIAKWLISCQKWRLTINITSHHPQLCRQPCNWAADQSLWLRVSIYSESQNPGRVTAPALCHNLVEAGTSLTFHWAYRIRTYYPEPPTMYRIDTWRMGEKVGETQCTQSQSQVPVARKNICRKHFKQKGKHSFNSVLICVKAYLCFPKVEVDTYWYCIATSGLITSSP